jgi:dUTPase
VELLRFKSGSQNWVDNTDLTFKNFIDVRGPNGGRVCLDGVWAHVDLQVDVAVAAIDGEDLPRSIHTATVEQLDGRARVKLRGDALRTIGYQLEGPDRMHEHADVGVGNNAAADVAVYIPFTKRYAKRGRDFALPAELLKEIVIRCSDGTDLGVAGGTITIDAGGTSKVYLIPTWHEEFSLELKAEDELKQTNFTNVTDAELNISGKLHDLSFFARGAGGGASLANFTDVQIAEGADGGGGGAVAYMPKPLLRDPDLVMEYRRKRHAGDSNTTVGAERYLDPHVNDRAVPVFVSDPTTRVYDGPFVDRVKFTCTNSVASMIAISRAVKPKSTDLADAVGARYGIRPEQMRVKTAGKTKRSTGAWEKALRVFMPMSAKLPMPGRAS